MLPQHSPSFRPFPPLFPLIPPSFFHASPPLLLSLVKVIRRCSSCSYPSHSHLPYVPLIYDQIPKPPSLFFPIAFALLSYSIIPLCFVWIKEAQRPRCPRRGRRGEEKRAVAVAVAAAAAAAHRPSAAARECAFNELEATCLRRELSLVAIAFSLSLSLSLSLLLPPPSLSFYVCPSAAIAISSLSPSVSDRRAVDRPSERASQPPGQSVKSLSYPLFLNQIRLDLSSYTLTHSLGHLIAEELKGWVGRRGTLEREFDV